MMTRNSTTFRLHSARQPFRGLIRVLLIMSFLALTLATGKPAMAQEDSALFWSISRQGEPAGYLLGTIHSEDPRVLDFSPRFIERMTENQVFAMEMVPDLPTLQQLTDYMQYQDGSTLQGQIGAERYARLKTALAAYNVPQKWVARMKVWAAMMTLSVPPPETGFFMDFSLSLRASGAGLEVIGLETLEQQLSFLEDMPMQQQLMLLDQALDESDKVVGIHREMVDSYLGGDLKELSLQAEQQLDELEPVAKEYFMKQGIEVRNQRMVSAVLDRLQTGRVFVAVGALHLPGPTGLIQLLRKNGYELKPLPLPFTAETPE
jgi:uncharacterized protein YbaP (TraB family)